jgi:hypothetical protein
MRRVVRTSSLTPRCSSSVQAPPHDGGRHTFGLGRSRQAALVATDTKDSKALSLSIHPGAVQCLLQAHSVTASTPCHGIGRLRCVLARTAIKQILLQRCHRGRKARSPTLVRSMRHFCKSHWF